MTFIIAQFSAMNDKSVNVDEGIFGMFAVCAGGDNFENVSSFRKVIDIEQELVIFGLLRVEVCGSDELTIQPDLGFTMLR